MNKKISKSMTIHFIGVGSAFTTSADFHSNILITVKSGKKMLIDCGSDARFTTAEWGRNHGELNPQIDAVYISHLHADHIGGLEWLAFSTYFNPKAAKPHIYGVDEHLSRLWKDSLRSGLKYIGDKVTSLTDYFVPHYLKPGKSFVWENIQFTTIKMLHVKNSEKNVYSYGLVIEEIDGGPGYLFTSDTVFDDNLLKTLKMWAPKVRFIFQDTETTPFRTSVHAHYEDLCSLPIDIRKKMWLYHHSPNPPYHPKDDGFKGFVSKGQSFG
ncbi:MAG: MBL fold metallo-hydrolase [Magnetococcales bacterium]|nr:MBL fold metallo-hydrolase [Magnetococcales bacterium]